jgi:hypothetical protein
MAGAASSEEEEEEEGTVLPAGFDCEPVREAGGAGGQEQYSQG